MDVDFEYLKRLKDAADEAIDTVENRDDRARLGPVNWGDLSCRDVGVLVRLDGSVTYQVFIEEADPSASLFQLAVAYELDLKGFDPQHIEVVTEW